MGYIVTTIMALGCAVLKYADFRWLGVMMGMLLFGVIAGHYYRKATTDNNTSIVPYLIISQMMIKYSLKCMWRNSYA